MIQPSDIVTSSAKAPATHVPASLGASYGVHGAIIVTLYFLAGTSFTEQPAIDIEQGHTSIQLDASISSTPTQLHEQSLEKAAPPESGVRDELTVNVPRMTLTSDSAQIAIEQAIETELSKPLSLGSENQDPPVTEEPPREQPEPMPVEEESAVPTPQTLASQAVPEASSQQGAQVDNYPEPLRTNSAPQYPLNAVKNRHEGRVILLVNVDARGKVEGLSIQKTSGHKELDDAAIETVSNWDFRPAHRSGKPVPFSIEVPFRFMLD